MSLISWWLAGFAIRNLQLRLYREGFNTIQLLPSLYDNLIMTDQITTECTKHNFQRLEAGRDQRDPDRLPAGEEGRGRVHLHRWEQRRQAPVSGLPEGE